MHQNSGVLRITSMIYDYNQSLPGLEQEIINRINKIQKKKILVNRVFYSLTSIISLFAIVFSLKYLIAMISNSGVIEYISMIFYDFPSINYWKELSLTVLDTMPFFEISINLVVFALFLWSVLKIIKTNQYKLI